MNDDILFEKTGAYQIIGKIEGDPVDWEIPGIRTICTGLLQDGSPRDYFFKADIRKFSKGLPHFYLDPSKSFDATTKSDSNFFQLIECYKNDTNGNLKEFLRYLITENALDVDAIKLLKCRKCERLTLSAGIRCGHCDYKKVQSDRRYNLYYLPREIKTLFNQPGKIIEGVLFYALKELEPKGIKIYPNVQLKYGEGTEKQELDLVIIDEKKTKIMVILSTISPMDRAEKKQCDILINNKIESIFVTTEKDRSIEAIKLKNELSNDQKIDIIGGITEDSDFLNKLLTKVSIYFKL